MFQVWSVRRSANSRKPRTRSARTPARPAGTSASNYASCSRAELDLHDINSKSFSRTVPLTAEGRESGGPFRGVIGWKDLMGDIDLAAMAAERARLQAEYITPE